MNALSFYGSKIILDRPNHFGWVPIILDRSKLQKLFHKSLIWTWPKLFGPNQNVSDLTKTIWMIQNLFRHKEGQGQSLNFIISGVENLIIWQFWWLVELQGLFHGCQHTLLTQLKLECKEMVLAKTRSSKVPCTVSELQFQVSKEVYILQWFALASVLCYGLIHKQCWFLSDLVESQN